MIYTALTKKAMKLAYAAHHGQVDKNGIPYIYHPIHLAEQLESEETVCIALLHDVVEDTDITFDDLQNEGFSDEIIKALKLLTHAHGEPYMEYISKIKQHPLATEVKLADLKHNSDLNRLDNVDDQSLKRTEKYIKAIALLQENADA